MSTYIHLLCLDHDPPLIAEEESGQHLYDLPRIREEVVNRNETVKCDRWYGGDDIVHYFRSRSARFLSQHPKCHIGIRDEYGRDYPLVEPS